MQRGNEHEEKLRRKKKSGSKKETAKWWRQQLGPLLLLTIINLVVIVRFWIRFISQDFIVQYFETYHSDDDLSPSEKEWRVQVHIFAWEHILGKKTRIDQTRDETFCCFEKFRKSLLSLWRLEGRIEQPIWKFWTKKWKKYISWESISTSNFNASQIVQTLFMRTRKMEVKK